MGPDSPHGTVTSVREKKRERARSGRCSSQGSFTAALSYGLPLLLSMLHSSSLSCFVLVWPSAFLISCRVLLVGQGLNVGFWLQGISYETALIGERSPPTAISGC